MVKNSFDGAKSGFGTSYFYNEKYISTDPALDRGKMFNDVECNKSLGLNNLLGDNAADIDLPLGGKLIVIAAAGDIEGERMQYLNFELMEAAAHGEEVCVIVAGAGHYALPPEGMPRSEIDLSKYVDPQYVHAAISNFSAGNSHTKAFRNPRSDIKYLMASHCSSEELSGNGSTIQHLIDSNIVPNENIFIYDSLLELGQISKEGECIVGTGTGAPPAAIAVIAALRHQNGIDSPLDIEIFGFDGTQELIHGKLGEMPNDYIDRGEVVVKVGGQTHAKVQKVYFDQMDQIVDMCTWYPGLINNVRVDGKNTLTAAIFNTPDGKPRQDYQVICPPETPDIAPEQG